jgi:creatinine amidohydrolase
MGESIDKRLNLEISNYGQVKNLNYDVVVLPWGATEPHNFHLPYLTDCILSREIALDAARLVNERSGINCMVLPPVNMGSQNPGQRELPFCIHARYETQKAILTDIVASLSVQGIRKLFIINGHGGNNFKNMIRDLSLDYPDFLIATSDWYSIVSPKGFFEEPGEHADELETSVMMYYHPELVNLAEAGKGQSKTFSVQSLNDKVAWIPRNWQKISEDTGIGNPLKSTAKKGEVYAKAVVEKYALLFDDLVNNTEFYKG